MVELEPPNAEDAALIWELLEEHVARTSSVKAKELLVDRERTMSRMIKVVPIEYRRVLEKLKKKREEEARAHAAQAAIEAAE
jgi:glutamate synthase domain-containing protein 3